MCDKKGSTLIESLFAFEIFITVIILFVGLFSGLYEKGKHNSKELSDAFRKGGEFTYSQDYIDIIEMALH